MTYLRCDLCDLAGEVAPAPSTRHPAGSCTNRVTVVPLGPGASALVTWDPDGQLCTGTLRTARPATAATIEEAA